MVGRFFSGEQSGQQMYVFFFILTWVWNISGLLMTPPTSSSPGTRAGPALPAASLTLPVGPPCKTTTTAPPIQQLPIQVLRAASSWLVTVFQQTSWKGIYEEKRWTIVEPMLHTRFSHTRVKSADRLCDVQQVARGGLFLRSVWL